MADKLLTLEVLQMLDAIVYSKLEAFWIPLCCGILRQVDFATFELN